MTLPAELRASLEARFGRVRAATPVAGGCIHPACRVELEDGVLFVKHGDRVPAGLFREEARGLQALAGARALVVPAVLALREAEEGPAWLALEWLERARPDAAHDEALGRGLAELHRPRGDSWGWTGDNFIGSLPQANRPCADWALFWHERRLGPQLRLSADAGRRPGTDADWERLFAVLPGALAAAGEEGPALLHGDLWSGNVMATARGPALVDPAVYLGHREVDLAMAELFGGFGERCFAAYRESHPLRPGYPVRRGIYQLYYLLVHVNLFGGGYVRQAADLLRRVLAAL